MDGDEEGKNGDEGMEGVRKGRWLGRRKEGVEGDWMEGVRRGELEEGGGSGKDGVEDR